MKSPPIVLYVCIYAAFLSFACIAARERGHNLAKAPNRLPVEEMEMQDYEAKANVLVQTCEKDLNKLKAQEQWDLEANSEDLQLLYTHLVGLLEKADGITSPSPRLVELRETLETSLSRVRSCAFDILLDVLFTLIYEIGRDLGSGLRLQLDKARYERTKSVILGHCQEAIERLMEVSGIHESLIANDGGLEYSKLGILSIGQKEIAGDIIPVFETLFFQLYEYKESSVDPLIDKCMLMLHAYATIAFKVQGMPSELISNVSWATTFRWSFISDLNHIVARDMDEKAFAEAWDKVVSQVEAIQGETYDPLGRATFSRLAAHIRLLARVQTELDDIRQQLLILFGPKKFQQPILDLVGRFPRLAADRALKTFLYWASPEGKRILALPALIDRDGESTEEVQRDMSSLYDLKTYLVALGQLFREDDIPSLLAEGRKRINVPEGLLKDLHTAISKSVRSLPQMKRATGADNLEIKYLRDVLSIMGSLVRSSLPLDAVPAEDPSEAANIDIHNVISRGEGEIVPDTLSPEITPCPATSHPIDSLGLSSFTDQDDRESVYYIGTAVGHKTRRSKLWLSSYWVLVVSSLLVVGMIYRYYRQRAAQHVLPSRSASSSLPPPSPPTYLERGAWYGPEKSAS